MRNSSFILVPAIFVPFLTSAAMADQLVANNGNITIEQASKYLHYSGSNDRMRVEIAPNYSEELGWSLKGAAGSYISDEIALGLIVEYGEYKREYLGNAGIRFNDAFSLVGSVGMLEENYEFIAGDGRRAVQQMEYGASLKGASEIGMLRGFELNGYLADADAGSSTIETGKLYGVQLMTGIDLTNNTHFKLGGGYEWLAWDNGDNNDSFTISVEGTQQLGDMLSLNASASVGASENVYGGGLSLDLSRGGANTSIIGLNYSYIDGKNGVKGDQRVEFGWTVGFGAGPMQMTSVETMDAGTIRPAADVSVVASANNLLDGVMKRPAFLPQTVIARARANGGSGTCTAAAFLANPSSFTVQSDSSNIFWYNLGDKIELDTKIYFDRTIDLYVADSNTATPSAFVLLVSAQRVVGSETPPDTTEVNHAPTPGGIWGFYEDSGRCQAIWWYDYSSL